MLAIGPVLLAGFAADRAWIRGNGIVAGELTAVSPIVQARLQSLFVKCLDHVTGGQRLAEFVNEAAVQFAAQQLHQLELQLSQARTSIGIFDREAEAARKLMEAQNALLQQQKAILKAEDQLLQHQNVAVLVWQQAKAAVERAEAETLAAGFVYETKRASQKMAELDADVLQKRIESFKNSPELTGNFYLTAPKDGIVTQCTARPGEVIAARTPIFSIFNPDDTYAVVFFDPGDVANLELDQTFNISIQGIDQPVTGRLTAFYPELSALPNSLTRYFWQREMWSQYVPARLDFTNLNDAQRSKLFAWAQLSASRWDGWGSGGGTAAASASWQWVLRHLDWARQFVASAFARGATNR
jgi:multidrug resistance efflux pump